MLRNYLYRTILIAVTFLFVSLSFSSAQEDVDRNGVSKACQEYYLAADRAVGTAEFNALNAELLKVATETGDKYADLQYYVLNLRHLCRGSSIPQVFEAAQLVRQKAKALGSDKFYFNAYTRTALYLTDNEPNEQRVIELMGEMLNDAKVMQSEYGVYEANRYLAILYRRRNDMIATRKYGSAAYEVYVNSNDPVVKGESIIIRTLIDCSETYPPGNDTIRFYLDEARRLSQIGIDTMRCDYADAKYYAVAGDRKKYEYYRDLAKGNQRYYKRYYPEGDIIFGATDAAYAGNWAEFDKYAAQLSSHPDLRYFCELSDAMGHPERSTKLALRLIDLFVDAIADNSRHQLDELSVQFGNVQLGTELHETTHRLRSTRAILFILTSLMSILLAAAFVYYVLRSRAATKKREQLIQELYTARDEAQRANQLKTSFVHNMSHEIRTPLNALVGFSQLLSLPDGYLTEEEKQNYASYITNNSSLLTMLIDDILSTADIEAGNYRLNFAQTDVASVCKYAGKTGEIRIQPGVDIRYYIDVPDGFEIYSDPARIQQVLINMITNACKNTESGSITIGCTTKEVPGFVTFYVADTGRGVPPEKAELIFERFIKLDQFKQGTGLGLSICKLIARLLQGDIYLDKTYTKGGARFVFNVPLEYKK